MAGPLDGAAGIVFGYQDSDNYGLYSVSSDGLYRLAKKVDGVWEDQIALTETGAANTGDQAKNRVGILVEGDQIALLVNDTVVDTYEDPAFSAGNIGVLAETFDTGEYTVDFDNLDVWDLGAAAPEPTEDPRRTHCRTH